MVIGTDESPKSRCWICEKEFFTHQLMLIGNGSEKLFCNKCYADAQRPNPSFAFISGDKSLADYIKRHEDS